MMKLLLQEPSFYSYQDEKVFFRWLEDLTATGDFRGKAQGLEITLKPDLTEADILDLLAWMTRYNLDRTQLTMLCTSENEAWFKNNTEAYWHEGVFGKLGTQSDEAET